MKKILITGGAGFVGTKLVLLLLEKGYYVKVLDNLIHNQIVFSEIKDARFEFIKGDITKEEDVKNALKDIDLIVHLAAIVGAPLCDKNPELAIKTNINGVEIINRLRVNIPIIFASTGSVYGKLNELCTEESPVNPLSLYGKTKYIGEQIIKKSGNYIIFRPATAFGVSPKMRTDLLINDLLLTALKTKKLIIFEGNAKRTFIHVSDFAMAIVYAIENFEKIKNKIYNLGNEKMNCLKKDIAKIIAKYTECEIEISRSGEDPDKRDYEVSYEKIRETGFNTCMSIEDGIRELIEYYYTLNKDLISNK
ncbi:NAD-dependent epimerase/dehydratase family protein [Candidatus Pacearchaeota archaeon]|nr:hypothetical protein [uncultured archaeon]MBS3078839.1 NAD-dependent epimerase/dehydratase family protein [Candidatus Pacearchaeota archaeon]